LFKHRCRHPQMMVLQLDMIGRAMGEFNSTPPTGRKNESQRLF